MALSTTDEIRVVALEDFMEAVKAMITERLDFDLRSYYRKKLSEAEAE
jgi:hypothetical protein